MFMHDKKLSRSLEKYLKWLTKPQKKLNGNPICPGLAPYRHQIHVLKADIDIESQLNRVCDLLYPLDVPAVIIYTALPPKDLWDITDECLQSRDDIEIFINDPKRKGKYRDIYTGWDSGTLIIVQRTDILEHSRKQAKKAGYYTHKKE